ncbi:MAG: LuxR C-terminal-related transcriptional regulator [Sediminibacterium sp.]
MNNHSNRNFIVEVYIKDRLILDWFINSIKNTSVLFDFNIHVSLNSLRNTLEFANGKKISVIDVEDNNSILFTKNYNFQNKKYKFLGVGFKKNITDISMLLSSNINGLMDVECNSLDFINAIESIEGGSTYMSDNIKASIIDNYLNSVSKIKSDPVSEEQIILKSNHIVLTAKEKNVCDLLAKGLSYKEIAIVLGVSTFTVNQKAKNIYKKLNVKSRAELSYQILTKYSANVL